MSVLCACYEIYLRDRFTGAEIEGCDFSKQQVDEGYWNRVLRGTSDAYIKYPLPDLFCCECLPKKWEHELVVDRVDESGESKEVWSGIVTRTIEDRIFGSFEVFARDRSVLWSRQPYATRDITFPVGTDEGVVWATLIQMSEECVLSGLSVQATETGCPITEEIVLLKGQDFFSILENLLSVQWSVVANRLLGPAANLQGEQVRHTLATDVDWADAGAVIDDDGDFTATHVHVSSVEPGVPGGFSGSWPTTEAEPSTGIGCHTLRIIDPKVRSDAGAARRAREIYDERKDGNRAVVTSAGSLSADTELCIDDLVPDRRVSIETNGTCADFVDIKKFSRMVANFALSTESGEACLAETRVAVDLIPPNGVDSSSRVSI